MPRLRLAMVAASVLVAGLPALASASPLDCLGAPDRDPAHCADAGGSRSGPHDTVAAVVDTALEAAGVCDPTDSAACLLPFPNDRFTRPDLATDTGRRLALPLAGMPRNVAGKPIDPTEMNRNDGFSPGSPILTSVPELDPARSGVAGIGDLQASTRRDSPVVLLHVESGKRAPHWGELDSNPTDGQQPLLIVRPATNLQEGDRYVVALRGLVDADGAPTRVDPDFARLRDAAVAKGRGAAADPVFGPLLADQVDLSRLQQAWTFTVASTRSLTERMLHLRDDAFAALGPDGAPSFTIGSVTEGVSARTRRRITGSFTLPSYLTVPVNSREPLLGADPGAPGTRFAYLDGDELPDRTGTFTATFTCNLPPTATASSPARGAVYGHGLLGGQSEVNAGNVGKLAVEGNIAFCATDWYGMATGDVPNVATFLADMSHFPTLPDRVQQGMLAQLFLARLVKSPQGFAGSPAFQDSGRPLVQPGAVYYDGNSQGGIIGGALLAVAQDITRGVLGVPGMNYSTLLDRSVDFAAYETVFNAAYPSERDRQLVFALIQTVWDRGEANGYAAHISRDPLPGTPRHQVLLHPAYGDHQVANVAAEVMARTIGAATNEGFLEPGRHWGDRPAEEGAGLPRFSGSHDGSALVYWDSGTTTPPDGNVPPAEDSTVAGRDPHGVPRDTLLARRQKDLFLRPGGVVVDTCGGLPCYGKGWKGALS